MDPFDLVAAERLRLADALGGLSDEEWEQPSLCGEWNNHQVAAHLNVPFTVNKLSFVIAMVKARGNFDAVNDRFAKDLALTLDPAGCVDGLSEHAKHRFTPPGYGPEAPLTDTIVHGEDILRPLGRSVDVAPAALSAVMHFLTSRKADRGFGALSVDDVHFEPHDVDVSIGHGGKVVNGPALSMVCALLGRGPFLDDLTGPGADILRSQIVARG